jgi:hypothetical protein
MGANEAYRTAELGRVVQQRREPFVEVVHPATTQALLLVDPDYNLVAPARDVTTCADAVSFAAVVKALRGSGDPRQPLVELRDNGQFVWRDDLEGRGLQEVRFQLKPAETACVLGLDRPFRLTQPDLLKLHEQHPEALEPIIEPLDDARDVTAEWAKVRNFASKEVSEVASESGENGIAVTIKRGASSDIQTLATYWHGESPVFHGHEPFAVKLRLEVVKPEADPATGAVRGFLGFSFSLWAPSAQEILDAAFVDATAQMALRLPDMTIIRGEIAETRG